MARAVDPAAGRQPLFFVGAELTLIADCVPFADPNMHAGQADTAIAAGCPKLDDGNAYIDKLTQILASNDIRGIKVAYMEVPCCRWSSSPNRRSGPAEKRSRSTWYWCRSTCRGWLGFKVLASFRGAGASACHLPTANSRWKTCPVHPSKEVLYAECSPRIVARRRSCHSSALLLSASCCCWRAWWAASWAWAGSPSPTLRVSPIFRTIPTPA